jgi:hypothetical protein
LAVELIGRTSNLTSKAYDVEAAQVSRLTQNPSDQGCCWWAILDLNQ